MRKSLPVKIYDSCSTTSGPNGWTKICTRLRFHVSWFRFSLFMKEEMLLYALSLTSQVIAFARIPVQDPFGLYHGSIQTPRHHGMPVSSVMEAVSQNMLLWQVASNYKGLCDEELQCVHVVTWMLISCAHIIIDKICIRMMHCLTKRRRKWINTIHHVPSYV
jgi:hypothetical protein